MHECAAVEYMSTTNLRVCLLILLVIGLDATYTLEQPSGSLLEYFPLFRYVLQRVQQWGGDESVRFLDYIM